MKNLRLFINFTVCGFIGVFVSCNSGTNKNFENTGQDLTVLETVHYSKDTNQGKEILLMRKDTDTFAKRQLKKVENVAQKTISQPHKNEPKYPENIGAVIPAKLDTTKRVPQLVYETEPTKDLYDTTKYKYIKHPGDGKWHLRTKTIGEKEGPRHRDINGVNMKKK